MENEVKKKKSKILILGIIGGLVLLGAIVAVTTIALSASGNASKKYDKQLDICEKFFDEMDYQNSILAYEKAIEIDPSNPEAYLGIVNVYVKLQDNENAEKWAHDGFLATGDSRLEEILNSLAEPEEEPMDLLTGAYKALEDLDFDLAIQLFEELLDKDPDNIEAYLGIIEVWLKKGDYEQANKWVKIGYDKTGDGRIKELEIPDNYFSDEKEYNPGDIVKFGKYEQDNNIDNGSEYIEWCVLSVEEDKILLYSKDILDYQPFNTEYVDISWEESSLRKWLNDDFYMNAFSNEEKEKVIENSNSCDDYYNERHVNNPTFDKVFCLSEEELLRFYKKERDSLWNTDYDVSELKSHSTDYTMERMSQYKDNDELVFEYSYWLRTCGSSDNALVEHSADFISEEGILHWGATIAYSGVRPAIYIRK